MPTNGTKKYLRKKKSCEAYRIRGQREKNKKIKIARHIKKFPNDAVAAKALNVLIHRKAAIP